MAIWGAIILDVVEQAVRDLEDSLIGNVLVGSSNERRQVSTIRQTEITAAKRTHWMPNLMPLNRLGSLSTSCSFTARFVDASVAMLGALVNFEVEIGLLRGS
jgi:hypothetical protein